MSSGETLLLLPAQRCLGLLPLRMPTGSPRRCLFGRPEFSINTIAEEEAEQRERMIANWDFDISTEQPVVPPKRYLWEAVYPEGERTPAPAAAPSLAKERREARKRGRVTPYKQLRLTDFWRTRKHDCLNKAKSESGMPQSSLEESRERE